MTPSPLQRHTPLRSKVGLAPTALKRVGKRGRRTQRETAKAAEARKVECGGVCEWPGCTETENLEAHHYLPRSRGGSNSVENIRMLHPEHHRMVHRRPLLAASLGLIHSSKIGGNDA